MINFIDINPNNIEYINIIKKDTARYDVTKITSNFDHVYQRYVESTLIIDRVINNEIPETVYNTLTYKQKTEIINTDINFYLRESGREHRFKIKDINKINRIQFEVEKLIRNSINSDTKIKLSDIENTIKQFDGSVYNHIVTVI